MTDYISRDEVLEHSEYTENFNLVVPVRFIKAMKAADVQPVKHGRWIDIYEYCKVLDLRPTGLQEYYWCSECDKAEKKTSDFCPNCGARMKQEG